MSTRLILPIKFSGERAARAMVRDNQLFGIGAQALWTDEGWRVVIHTARPEAVAKYLAEKLPGVTWEQRAD